MRKILSASLLVLVSSWAFSQNTFTRIHTILQTNCAVSGCHTGTSPTGSLNLSGNETALYNTIVEVTPNNAAAAAKGDKYIDKGYPERSFLLRKIAHGLSSDLQLGANEGDPMPYGLAKLNDQDIELVRQWIIMGAPQSGNVVDYNRLVTYYTTGGRPKITPPPAPPAGQGFQIHFGPIFWAAGQEVEYFKKHDPRISQNIEINKFEVYMNNESHHFILRKFQPGKAGNYTDELKPFSTQAFSDDKDFLNAWQSSSDLELPTGTGFFWDQSTVLDLNYHMFNSHNEVLPGECYINVYTKPRGATTVEMKAELIPNLYIYIPNNNSNVSYSDNLQRSGQTWNIWMLSTHTHKYGVDYDIFLRNSNGSQGTQLYEGHHDPTHTINIGYYDYEHPPVKRFSPMQTVNMSNGLIHKATYKNNGPSPVTWGFTTNEEMMLIYVQYTTQAINYKPGVAVNGSNPGCDPVTLTADGGHAAYAWSSGETTPEIIVSQSGVYTVTVTDGSGTTFTSDPVNVSISTPQVSLNDISICAGENAVLDAGNQGVAYVWSSSANTAQINVTTAGNYAVTVTDANGCAASDTATVTVNPLPVISINNATICSGGNVTFNAGNAGATYLWSDNSTSQSITVYQAGSYSVTVTSSQGCVSSKQVTLTIGTSLSIAIQDEEICDGETFTLDAGYPGATYAWSTGETSQTITVDAAGVYSVVVDDGTGCSGTGGSTVTVLPAPNVDAGSDAIVCNGQSAVLTANGGLNYQWSNNATGNSITVQNEGTYTVTATDANGCSASDDVAVVVSSVQIDSLFGSMTAAVSETKQYSVNENPGSTYQWNVSNGSIASGQGTATIEVTWNSAGTGIVEVTETNAHGCNGVTTLEVSVGTVGIFSAKAANVTIFPNPAKDWFKVVFENAASEPFEIYLMDISGKKVYMKNKIIGNEVIIDRSGLNDGIYFVEVKGKEIFRGKIILTH